MLADDGKGLALPAVPQLRRRQPRRRRRDARPPAHRAGPRRRRRPRRHDLRRQLPDHAARATGAATATTAGSPLPFLVQRHCRDTAAHRRAARPRRARARATAPTQRHRLRPPPAPQARDRPRPARRRPPPRAARPTATSAHDRRRRGHLRATARPPGRCPAASSAAPQARTDAGAATMSTIDISTDTVVPLEPHVRVAARPTSATPTSSSSTDADQLAELDAALAHAESVTDDVLDITRDDFPLPTLGARARTTSRDELIDGRGVVLHPAALAVDRLRQGATRRRSTGASACTSASRGRRTRRATCSATSPTRARRRRPDRARQRDRRRSRSRSTPTAPTSSACSASTPGRAAARASWPTRVAPQRARAHGTELAAELYEPFPYDFRGEQRAGRQAVVHDADLHPARRPAVRALHPPVHRGVATPRGRAADHRRPARGDGPRRRDDRRRRHTASRWRCEPGDMQFVNNYHVLHARRRVHRRPRGRPRPPPQAAVAGDRRARPRRPPRALPARRLDEPLGPTAHPRLTLLTTALITV